MSISQKFTLALLGYVVVAVSVYALITVRDDVARWEAEQVDHESSTAHALRPALRDVWMHGGEARALELIQEEQQRLGGLDIRYVSLDPGAPPTKRPRVTLEQLGPIAAAEDVLVVDRAFRDEGRMFTYVPVLVTAPFPVAIEVSQSLAGERGLRRTGVRRAAIVAAAVALISGVVTMLLSLVLIQRPLSQLVAQARRVGEGDLSFRIEASRTDEISVVGREMNRMCDRLGEARRSERAQAEAKGQALAQLRHADRLATVGRLAAGLAHELGTPLNVVQARARQMSSGSCSTAEVADKSRIIVEQVDRMAGLIRQLLDFARKRELKPETVDLHALVSRAMKLLEPIARKRSVSIEVTSEAAPVTGRVDPEQMTQVFLNLAMNAVHASNPGGSVAVALARGRDTPPPDDGRTEQPCVRVEVRDRGAGMAPETLSRIFEPFFTTKDVGEGTGLGLSVAYGIVKDHGGWIDVSSVRGEGSVFTVWLPEGGGA